jgi:hypothetical protein
MPIVQISGRVIDWPGVCACCCQLADTVLGVGRTRLGVAAGADEPRWRIPYCSRCLQHIEAAGEVQALTRQAQATARLRPVVTACVFGSGLFLCCAVTGLLIAAIGAPAILVFPFLAGPLAYLAYQLLTWEQTRLAERREAAAETVRRAEERARKLLRPTCCDLGPAVSYEGCYGAVQTFDFSNPEFVAHFKNLNGKKCLE